MALLCETSANKATESNFPSTIDHLGSPFSEDSVITSPSPGSICEVVTETPSRLSPQPNRKRKQDSQASVLTLFLAECDAMLKKSMEDDNGEGAFYCRSLIPIMSCLRR